MSRIDVPDLPQREVLDGPLPFRERRAVLKELAERHRKATKGDKRRLLDEAEKLLRRNRPAFDHARPIHSFDGIELLFYIGGMEYLRGSAKSALQRVHGMPFAWSLNPYRGCRHACLYCYARIYHSYIGFEDPADFDRVILHKADLPLTLQRELMARRSPLLGDVAIGTATDPYQPLEAKERITRRCLEVLLEAGQAVTITTKSPLVTRDLDLLQAFAAYGGIRVHLTVTVLEADLWRLLEPMTPRPDSRLAALADLRAAGVPASLFLAPVVPAIGEREALRVLDAAADVGAEHVMAQPLRLSSGVRTWLLPRIASSLPQGTRELERLYGRRETLPTAERERVMAPIAAKRDALGLARQVPPLRRRGEQLTLFATESLPMPHRA